MKLRIVPTLLLLGLFTLGLTQSIAGQVIENQFETTAIVASQAVQAKVLSESTLAYPTPTATVSQDQATSPATTKTNSVQKTPGPSTSLPTPESTPSVPSITGAASSPASPNIFSAQVGTGISEVILTGADILQGIEAFSSQASAFGNQNVAQADPSVATSPTLVDQLTRLDPSDGEFDLSRLRLESLAQIPTLQTASQNETEAAAKLAAVPQFNLGASGIIPDETAKLLAQEDLAPKLWPVRGPVTSTFGPRPVLVFPAATSSTTGKGGAGPTTVTGTTATESQPTATPTPTLKPAVTPTPTPAIKPTPTPTLTPAVSTAPVTTTTQPTPTVPPTTGPTQPTPPGQSEIIQTPAIQIPATSPDAAFSPVPVSPTTTGAISPEPTQTPAGPTVTPTPTATPTPTPTPTATPFPSGPIPLINGSLGAVGPGEEFHTGLDIAVVEGTEVHATADGVVLYAGDGGGYGRVVFIQHAGGFVTVYGHNSRLLVVAGQTVKAGQTISLSGSTGYSTGPHVHYEVRYQGKIANPALFLK